MLGRMARRDNDAPVMVAELQALALLQAAIAVGQGVDELAKAAKRITYVSQYCPTGRLSAYLKKADSRLYFNPWRTAKLPNSVIIRFGELFSGLASSYTRSTYLHAKFIIFDMPDGTRVALTGSHNFPRGGMWVGTREIALETTDKHIIAHKIVNVNTNFENSAFYFLKSCFLFFGF